MKTILKRKISLTLLTFIMIFNIVIPANAQEQTFSNEPSYSEFESDDHLIPITPYTNIDELPNIEKDSDIYNDLKSIQLEMMRQRNLIPNLVFAKAGMAGTNKICVSVRNIGIDTLDSAYVSLVGYNSKSQINMRDGVYHYKIKPMAWRDANFYCERYHHSLITITARDGSVARTGAFYHYK